MIMWTKHPRLDWIGVLLFIVQSCARFSGSLTTLVLLLCLCGGITGLQSDYDRRHFYYQRGFIPDRLRCAKMMTLCYGAAPNNAVQLPESHYLLIS